MKNTVTRILTIVALAIFAALAVTAIVLAVVKTNYNQVVNGDVNGITVYQNGSSNFYSKNSENAEDKETFNKLLNKYYEGTKESVLSSLFQGAYSKNAKAEVVKSNGTTISSITNAADSFFLQFHFSKEQTLKINDKEYVDDKLTQLDKTVKFNSALFEVENNTTLTKVTMYIISSSNGTSSNTNSYYQVKFVTHSSSLYKFVSDDLDFPGKAV